MLSDRQYRFVQEYCKDFIATSAYIRAGYSENGAAQSASKLLTNPEIQAAIEDEKRNIAALAGLSRGYLVRELTSVVNSDRPRCCRYCYGIEHKYQWTEREYARELSKALEAGQTVPDFSGGFGYLKNRAPFEECPACEGEGILKPTLEAPKKADKIKAIDLLSKLGGLIVERKELSGPGGGPLAMATLAVTNPQELSTEELEQYLLANGFGKGIIEGTLALPDGNSNESNELEANVNP